MDAKSKRKLERDQQIEKRREEIKDAAIQEFIEKGIDNSTIGDIAKRAEVGVATVYRYFETKPKLVIECATKLWSGEMKSLKPRIYPETFSSLSGFEQVKKILVIFGSLLDECPVFLRLLEQFDNYIVKERVPREELISYEAGILDTRAMMINAIVTGQKDGSIRSDLDGMQFYTTATHAIVALSQKLLLRGDIISSDSEFDVQSQINLLVDMELNYIKHMR